MSLNVTVLAPASYSAGLQWLTMTLLYLRIPVCNWLVAPDGTDGTASLSLQCQVALQCHSSLTHGYNNIYLLGSTHRLGTWHSLGTWAWEFTGDMGALWRNWHSLEILAFIGNNYVVWGPWQRLATLLMLVFITDIGSHNILSEYWHSF